MNTLDKQFYEFLNKEYPLLDINSIHAQQMRKVWNASRNCLSDNIPSSADFRLHMGELTSDELLIAKSAYRYAISQIKI